MSTSDFNWKKQGFGASFSAKSLKTGIPCPIVSSDSLQSAKHWHCPENQSDCITNKKRCRWAAVDQLILRHLSYA